ncbi:MAG TPA: T9SS type A sorting domain-containing protein [Flavobacteriaceae bacterium]|nr:T9SS type A sorting domain-containing protein [Flavobacteriaceae bacterium]
MDVGSYTNLLLEINPTQTPGQFPNDWTLQTVNISGLSGLTDVRIAFRYYVADEGPNGNNSNYIGIDEVSVTSALAVDDAHLKELKYVYNPNSKILSLKSKSALHKITIYNLLGQKVFADRLQGNSNRVNLSTMVTGVYIAKIEGNNNSQRTIKLVVH